MKRRSNTPIRPDKNRHFSACVRYSVLYHIYTRMNLNPESPVPLYHQIAEVLRYQIGTGRLSPGASLPPVRTAAATWGVNMHTVRRAYAELAQEGLVEIRGAQGTRVLGSTHTAQQEPWERALDRFVRRVVREASTKHNLTPETLAHLIANWSLTTSATKPVVHVVECSDDQCADHAHEIQSRWQVDARPWCLAREGEPPAGPVVATYFHHNDIRERWPNRLREIRFATIHLDPELQARIGRPKGRGKRTTLTLCEFEESVARVIASDLSVLFPPDRFRIRLRVLKHAAEVLQPSKSRTTVLFSPRAWGALTPDERNDPRAIKVKYIFPEDELQAIGTHFGWRARQ
ncbi:MAG: GntR family transcriptional regulator [Phycisphaerales bacterium]|nr:MAG: GntR family transcriptional regulator [Phycisphaerales bacterium]